MKTFIKIPAVFAVVLTALTGGADVQYTRIDLSGITASQVTVGTTKTLTTDIGTPKSAFNNTGMSGDDYMYYPVTSGNPAFMINKDSSSTEWFPVALQIDFGENKNIDRIKLFNHNRNNYRERGFKDFKVYYCADGGTKYVKVADIRSNYTLAYTGVLAQGTGSATYAGQTYNLENTITARYVAFVFTSTHSGNKTYYSGLGQAQFFTMDVAGEPHLSDVGFNKNGDNYVVSGSLRGAESTVCAVATSADGQDVRNFGSSVRQPDTSFGITVDPSTLTTNTSYMLSMHAEANSVTDDKDAGSIYTGDVSIAKTSDGSERDFVPATFTVSVPVAPGYDIDVNYTVSGGTGTAGTSFAAPSGTVKIPAGSTSAVISVVPLVDPSVEDRTVELSLASGDYLVGAAASAVATIANYALPDGYNVWLSATAANASVAANWSDGELPAVSDNKPMLNGGFANGNITWDIGSTVPSLRCVDYTGTFIANRATIAFQPGDEPLAVGGLTIGVSTATAATLGEGVYNVGTVKLHTANGSLRSSLTLSDGAVLNANSFNGCNFAQYTSSGYSTTVTVSDGAVLNVAGQYDAGTGNNVGPLVQILGSLNTGSLSVGSKATFNVDGGAVTNAGVAQLKGNGEKITLKNGASFKQTGAINMQSKTGSATFNVFSGSVLDAADVVLVPYNSQDTTGYEAAFVVSNATANVANIIMPRDWRASKTRLRIYESEADATEVNVGGNVEIGCYPDGNSTQPNNAAIVYGGSLNVTGSIKVGKTGYGKAQGDSFQIVGAGADVTAGAFELGTDCSLQFKIPEDGFAGVPLHVTGALAFNDDSTVSVDCSKLMASGRITLAVAGSLTGLAPEEVTFVPNASQGFIADNYRAYVSGTTLEIFAPNVGTLIMVR